MPKDEVKPEDCIELNTKEELDAALATKDINVVDVYAEWCGPCTCLAQTYKKILFDNDAVVSQAKEEFGKTVKYWKVCAEKVEGFDDYHGNPCPAILVYVKGEVKFKLTGANAPKLLTGIGEVSLLSPSQPLRARGRGRGWHGQICADQMLRRCCDCDCVVRGPDNPTLSAACLFWVLVLLLCGDCQSIALAAAGGLPDLSVQPRGA
eukprot:SAG22_NODE_972_length_6227_cov_16.910085_1_plen_207_part_00